MNCEQIITKAAFLKSAEIHTAFCHAILEDKPHTARLITEQLREMYPRSKQILELDTIVTNTYFG